MKGRYHQSGIAALETAIIGVVAMVTLFGVIEVGRMLYVFNALEEATRRGARVAAVCTVGDAAIAQIAAFTPGGGGASPVVGGLTSANFQVQYLDINGNVIGDTTANYGAIEFVRVQLVNFQHQLLIPTLTQVVNVPDFSTTLPRESLGVSREGISTC